MKCPFVFVSFHRGSRLPLLLKQAHCQLLPGALPTFNYGACAPVKSAHQTQFTLLPLAPPLPLLTPLSSFASLVFLVSCLLSLLCSVCLSVSVMSPLRDSFHSFSHSLLVLTQLRTVCSLIGMPWQGPLRGAHFALFILFFFIVTVLIFHPWQISCP